MPANGRWDLTRRLKVNKTKLSRQILEDYSNIVLNENSASGNQIIPCGGAGRQTDRRTDGRTEKT